MTRSRHKRPIEDLKGELRKKEKLIRQLIERIKELEWATSKDKTCKPNTKEKPIKENACPKCSGTITNITLGNRLITICKDCGLRKIYKL